MWNLLLKKLKLVPLSVHSLDLNTSKPASQLHKLIQTHYPAHQITPKIEAIDKAINLISTHAARVHKHDYYISLASRKQATNTNRNLNNSNMHIPHPECQLTVHSLSEIQHIVNNHSRIGTIAISNSARLNSISLISQQLSKIPQIILKVISHI